MFTNSSTLDVWLDSRCALSSTENWLNIRSIWEWSIILTWVLLVNVWKVFDVIRENAFSSILCNVYVNWNSINSRNTMRCITRVLWIFQTFDGRSNVKELENYLNFAPNIPKTWNLAAKFNYIFSLRFSIFPKKITQNLKGYCF